MMEELAEEIGTPLEKSCSIDGGDKQGVIKLDIAAEMTVIPTPKINRKRCT
jgi:hypothetical protein